MSVITYKCDHCGKELSNINSGIRCEFNFNYTGTGVEQHLSYDLCSDCLFEFLAITREFMRNNNEREEY